MMRLIEKGLMYGNLFHVNGQAMADRYNRALKHLTGKETALTDFHVDISGYAPEVGEELGDHLYLNPKGCNRQFILLSIEQKTAPLLEAKFSTSRGILRQFIDANEAQLFALTARDAVAGELVNSVYSVTKPAHLFDIRKIRVEADTTSGVVADAGKLDGMIAEFRARDDAWWDDVLIADMIKLAHKTGDVTRVPIKLGHADYEQENFWTSHFGGLYAFRDVEKPAVISMSEDDLGNLPVGKGGAAIGASERTKIAKFLDDNELVEPIVKARGVDAVAILRQKLDFIVVDVAATMEADLSQVRRTDLRSLARRYSDLLPPEFHTLGKLLRWAEGGGAWPRISSNDPAYFYTLRAKPHKDRDLVNMLLSELSLLDVRQLFICHKELFYARYRSWPDQKKAFVADFLAREYQVDKAGAREALFGSGDAPMEEPLQSAPRDVVEVVGPWGAVRRTR
ncbi:hypothetical protein SAMN05444273_103329 [Litoreibacter ascidiaceicola]|uniref:Uncharacterized protein n=1 Tax=Litoreibacter ascidiaceicola TaxID=1486859 RepID=A0A1M4XWK4_9RHOB|nr:DUF6638 family protein [Litoreibacter ascidiaceicola]SHE97820.1 hypothetical protein SAMN05444273_103329 [Litoreibacter ascidiaceicola]